jgi:hypothetical protein
MSEIVWFAEVDQKLKQACSECKNLAWPLWWSESLSYTTNDPNQATRFSSEAECYSRCIRGLMPMHGHLRPTEHMFIDEPEQEERKS